MSNNSADSAGWVSIKYILANTKARLRIDDRHDQYLRQYIYDGISELNIFNLDITGHKTKYLDISEINTVDLPIDYIDYIKIGRVVNGNIVTLTYNPNIPIPVSSDCAEDTNPFPDMEKVIPGVPRFGAGGGYNVAEYRIDKQGQRIIIQGTVPGDQICLEYISTGISMNEETMIQRKYVPVIRAYVIWSYHVNDSKMPMNMKEYYASIYRQEVSRVSMSEMPTIDEMIDAIRMGYRQTPKR